MVSGTARDCPTLFCIVQGNRKGLPALFCIVQSNPQGIALHYFALRRATARDCPYIGYNFIAYPVPVLLL
jgi:hypothetical protein